MPYSTICTLVYDFPEKDSELKKRLRTEIIPQLKLDHPTVETHFGGILPNLHATFRGNSYDHIGPAIIYFITAYGLPKDIKGDGSSKVQIIRERLIPLVREKYPQIVESLELLVKPK